MHTDLSHKLGLMPGYKVLVYNVPNNYGEMLGKITDQIYWLESISRESANFIHLFSTEEKDLEEAIQRYIPALKSSGVLWISWPAQESASKTNLNKQDVCDLVFNNSSLVDVKFTDIDENWNGLKFIYKH